MKAPTYNSILWPKTIIWTGRRAKRLITPLASQDTDIPSAWICSTCLYTYVTFETSLFNLIYVGWCELVSISCTRKSTSDHLLIFFVDIFLYPFEAEAWDLVLIVQESSRGSSEIFHLWYRLVEKADRRGRPGDLYWYFRMFSKKKYFLHLCLYF